MVESAEYPAPLSRDSETSNEDLPNILVLTPEEVTSIDLQARKSVLLLELELIDNALSSITPKEQLPFPQALTFSPREMTPLAVWQRRQAFLAGSTDEKK